MRRRLFTFCSAVSLLLCAAVGGLWVRGRGGTADWWEAGYFRRHPNPEFDGYENGKKLVVIHRGGRLFAAWEEVGCIAGPGRETRGGPGDAGERWLHRAMSTRDAEDGVAESWWSVNPGDGVAGVRWQAEEPGAPAAVDLPDATAAAALAVLPAWLATARVIGYRRRRRLRREGRCAGCGYDLRVQRELSGRSETGGKATPGTCPECGAAGTVAA